MNTQSLNPTSESGADSGSVSALLSELLSELRTAGIRLWVECDNLRYKAPKGSLTPDRIARLKAHKAEIVAFLQQAQAVNESVLPPLVCQPREPGQVSYFPLSFGQQRLWFLDQLEGANPTYNMPISLRLNGPLDIQVLEASLQTIAARHESLRTRFATQQDQPVQVIEPVAKLPVQLVDLRSPDLNKRTGDQSSEQKAELAQCLAQETRRPFDLSSGPLIRVSLFQLAAQSYVLLVNMHHSISDGWSLGIFAQELSSIYGDCLNGNGVALPAHSVQYADFAQWQRQWLSGDRLTAQLDYWKKQLSGLPPLLELPTDHARPPIQTFQGKQQRFEISAALTAQLVALSQQAETTLFMTLQAAFALLLSRYSRQSDIVMGSPVANRTVKEVESLIGFFANTLILRTDLSGNPSFLALLSRVKQTCVEAYAHQAVPFEKLVEELNPPRNLSYSPIFQVMFALQNSMTEDLHFAGIETEDLSAEIAEGMAIAKFDLTLTLERTDQGLTGIWEYNSDLFEAETMTRWSGHFQQLLSSIVARPTDAVETLEWLPELEYRQLLEKQFAGQQFANQQFTDQQITEQENASNLALSAGGQQSCIHQLFEAQVVRSPHEIAITCGNEQITYQALEHRANQLAHHLQRLGIGPDSLVGICLDRSIDMVIGLLGVLKAGGAYVPLDPTYPAERLSYMVSHSQLATLLIHAKYESLWGDLTQTQPLQIVDIHASEISQQPVSSPAVSSPETAVTAEHLAYVIYTSGSTGKPKGVQIEHRAAVNFLAAVRQKPGISQQDRLLAVTTISFDIAVLELFLPLTVGAQVILASQAIAADALQLSALLSESQATIMQATPATWQMLLTSGWQGLAQLKILCGGEALPRPLANQLIERGRELWNLYGPTEATVWATACQIQADNGPVPVAGPLENTQLYVLETIAVSADKTTDKTTGKTTGKTMLRPLPIGVPGEVYIGGAGLARGYLNRPDLTAERFVENPFMRPTNNKRHKNNRLYKTGDLARFRPDGSLEFLGRIDNQVKIRGFRIELGEIESALDQHAAVRQSVVVAQRDNSGQSQLVAYWLAEANGLAETAHPQTVTEFRQHLQTLLPAYMVPMAFVRLEAFPLTPNGKINRRALPPVQAVDLQPTEAYVAPRTGLEQQFADVWQTVLGLEKIGIHDNFFELGGHSLRAAQVVAQLQSKSHLTIPLSDLFEHPTIAALVARAVNQGQSPESISSARPQAENSATENNVLVLLRQGLPSQPTLFLIHDADGDISLYGNLARQLGDTALAQYSVYGVQPRTEAGMPVMQTQIKTIAADYLAYIQQIQPHGPYLLGGLCIGGVLATEIALQLEAKGEAVALVALLDSIANDVEWLPDYQPGQKRALSRKKKLFTALKSLGQGPNEVSKATKEIATSAKNWLAYRTEEQLESLQTNLFRQFSELGGQSLPKVLSGVSVRSLLLSALGDYQSVGCLSAHILLIKASSGMTPEAPALSEMSADPLMGWERLSATPLEVHTVSGGHSSMLSAEKAHESAEILAHSIENALSSMVLADQN